MFFTDKMGFKKIRKLGLQAFVWVIESFLLEVHGFQGFPSAWLAKPWVLDFAWGGEQLLGDIGDHRPRRKVVSARSTTPTVFESLDIA